MTHAPKRWGLLLAGALLVFSSSTARAQQVSVTPVSSSVTVSGSTLQATFKIQVVNSESSPMTNFFVFFEDGTYVTIGDVNAGATVVSDTVTRLVDLTGKPPSRNQPIRVTLKFSLDGQNVERPWAITLTVPE